MKKAPIEVLSPFRSRTLRSLSGAVIPFAKNQKQSIPASLLEEAVSIGLVPADEVDVELGAEPAREQKLSEDERDGKVKAAIETIMARNERDDWNGSGKPAKLVVSTIVGFQADQRVVNRIYGEILDAQKEAEAAED